MTKVCTACEQEKPLDGFHINGNGRHNMCAPCRLAHRKAQRPGQPRARDLRQKYGLSVVQFLSLAKHQDEKCAICKLQLPLVVDHDHATGRVRGLLCIKCNVLVGPDDSRAELLRRAAAYVQA